MSSSSREPAKLSDLKTHREHIAETLSSDPEYRELWERTALARAVAIAVVRYRGEHGLTQEQLGVDLLRMPQSQVARLESGAVNPSMETLMHLSACLGLEFTIDVRPAGRPSRFVTKRARDAQWRAEAENDFVSVLVAATA